MGFWDKVKQVKNMVTGGAAEVVVLFHENELELGKPFNITIKAQVKDVDLAIDKVYLKLRAEERVEGEGVEIEYEEGETEIEREIIHLRTTTYEDKLMVEGPMTLEAQQVYEWNVQLVIPEDLNGTYKGKFAWHEYALFAGLDAAGNDPDSGWVPFDIF
ncbi:sporulation protein [Sediminitomix flava]|uniref:SpoOM protein n=1 Tax=Sediminitomix flava TaxID=379075 RepID=A0A315ZZK0_SEDFL|nr:sporulation protein [Sediminitomix flava]PWJ42797.1 SpoOM protein [Sediminitomix flava]